jgi:hypothetical protein
MPERTGPPLARTIAEASVYMLIHPCECGDPTKPSDVSGSIDWEFRATLVYSGDCPSCGTHRRFEFRRPDPGAERGRDHEIFGPGRSELLDAGEWLWVAAMTMDSPGNPDDTVKTACAAIEQAFKFMPPGKRAIPRSALRSERSREMLAADPTAFEFDRMRRLFRTGFGGSAATPTASASRRIALRADPVQIQVPGRCPAGSFSPDGSQLAVASGFEQINRTPEGEVSVFATDDGRCLQRHVLEAWTVRILCTGYGVLVADWQIRDGTLTAGRLARYTGHRHEVLAEDIGINVLANSPAGFAALTDQGELLLGAGDDLRMLPPPGPRSRLAVDLGSGRIAVGGDRIVLLDEAGRPLATADTPSGVLAMAFVGPDRLITAEPGLITMWDLDGDTLTVGARTEAVPYLADLAVVPHQNLVVGVDRGLWMALVHVGRDALHVIETPEALHGRVIWGSPSGERIALPDRINDAFAPAPEQVEVHDTRAW